MQNTYRKAVLGAINLLLGLWPTYHENIGGQLWLWWGSAPPRPTMITTDPLYFRSRPAINLITNNVI